MTAGGEVRSDDGLAAFVADRGPALVRFACILNGGDWYAAQDLVQAALVRVLGRWRRVAAGGAPEAYLRRVIVTQYLSWRRRRASGEHLLDRLPDRPAPGTGFAAVEAEDAVWRLVAGLPPRQRAVLVLRYLADWPDPEIAAALGCREATVRSLASRGLAAIRADRTGLAPASDREHP